jgi:hypothetical protein
VNRQAIFRVLVRELDPGTKVKLKKALHSGSKVPLPPQDLLGTTHTAEKKATKKNRTRFLSTGGWVDGTVKSVSKPFFFTFASKATALLKL